MLHKDPLWRDLDLVPVMNIFMILIPFLLLSAVFVKTAIIDIHLPQEKLAGKEAPKITPKGFLTIHVTEKGFSFGGIGKDMRTIKRKGGALDFKLLSEKLLKLKEKNPETDEAIILFKGDTPYELVIKTMDAAREIIKVKDGDTVRRTLFPLVSVGEHIRKRKR
jgi:biopolymer transport protein ExbD